MCSSFFDVDDQVREPAQWPTSQPRNVQFVGEPRPTDSGTLAEQGIGVLEPAEVAGLDSVRGRSPNWKVGPCGTSGGARESAMPFAAVIEAVEAVADRWFGRTPRPRR